MTPTRSRQRAIQSLVNDGTFLTIVLGDRVEVMAIVEMEELIHQRALGFAEIVKQIDVVIDASAVTIVAEKFLLLLVNATSAAHHAGKSVKIRDASAAFARAVCLTGKTALCREDGQVWSQIDLEIVREDTPDRNTNK